MQIERKAVIGHQFAAFATTNEFEFLTRKKDDAVAAVFTP